MNKWLSKLFIRRPRSARDFGESGVSETAVPFLHAEQEEQFTQDMQVLEPGGDANRDRLIRDAEKEVRSVAAESLKRLAVARYGHCPVCGAALTKRPYVSVCEECGWNSYDVPRKGVRVHLTDGECVAGDQCNAVKGGDVLLIRDDFVAERISAAMVQRIEYLWDADEMEQHHRLLVERLAILCGWCNQEANPEAEGFHIVHIAFGTTQERYCFCSDECYEAFRSMYPARVHRNCYERSCKDCNLCIKRYDEDESTLRILGKDILKMNGRF